MTIRGDVLQDAIAAIDGDRNNDYGDPKDNFEDTAALWNAYFGGATNPDELLPYEPFTPEDIAIAMILVKLARLKGNMAKRDTWQDIAGWAACGYEVAAEDPPTTVNTPPLTLAMAKGLYPTDVPSPASPVQWGRKDIFGNIRVSPMQAATHYRVAPSEEWVERVEGGTPA